MCNCMAPTNYFSTTLNSTRTKLVIAMVTIGVIFPTTIPMEQVISHTIDCIDAGYGAYIIYGHTCTSFIFGSKYKRRKSGLATRDYIDYIDSVWNRYNLWSYLFIEKQKLIF